jgi:hypothetical protein
MNDQCIGLDDPHGCCTGEGEGTCDDPKKFCDWYDETPGSFVSGRFGSAIEINDQPIEVGTENCQWSTSAAYHGTWKYTDMKYNMTLEAWVYPTADDGERKIMTKHTLTNGGYALTLKQFNGLLRVGLITFMDQNKVDCGGMRGAYSSVSIPLNTWTHVAATYDAAGPDRYSGDGSVGRIRIYVNGEDVTDSSSDPAACYAQPGPGEDAMFPHSDWNDIDPSVCYNGHWCASALSIGGYNWSSPSNNFIGKLDELKVWNITKDSTYFETADSQAGPYISNVTGVIGSDQITVTFSEGVYTDAGSSGDLIPADFSFIGGSLSVDSVAHTAGSDSAVLTLSGPLPTICDDYTLAAVGSDRFYTECDFVARLPGLASNIQPE